MSTDLLAADTRMGAVTLRVADLDMMTAYYRDAVTLDLLARRASEVVLGRGTEPILVLVHAPALQHAPSRAAGLFHTAILFDSEADLATAVHAVATRHPGTFTGSADHLVSQAFYFNDPEGNGVELYCDRDRSAWSWTHGRVEMATLMLDPNRFLRDISTRPPWPRHASRPATVGHVHLCVGDVRLGPQVLRRPARLRDHRRTRQHGPVRQRRWLPPPHGDEHLAEPRRRPTPADPGARSGPDRGALHRRPRQPDRPAHLPRRGDPRRRPHRRFDDPWANRIQVRAAA